MYIIYHLYSCLLGSCDITYKNKKKGSSILIFLVAISKKKKNTHERRIMKNI